MRCFLSASFAVCLALLSVPLAAQSEAASPPPGIATSAGLARLLESHGLTGDLQRIEQVYPRYAERIAGARYLRSTKALFEEPLRGLDFADELSASLMASARAGRLPALLQRSAQLLDVDAVAVPVPAPRTMQELVTRLEEAHALAEAAFADLTDEERSTLEADTRQLLDDFVRHIYVHERQSNVAVWERAQRIDLSKLFAAAQQLCTLLDPGVLAALLEDARGLPAEQRLDAARPEGLGGELLYCRRSAAGLVVIGTMGPNRYAAPLAFVLDPGGDDEYAAAATRSSPAQRINVVCDLAGRDRYLADEYFAQGCGHQGCALLFDAGGDDEYRGTRAAQGAGVLGIGLLFDAAGDDIYAGDAYCQGAGLFGVGALVEGGGSDRMEAKLASLGFAGASAVGLLVDLAGDDVRHATGAYPSSYGTKGEYHGLAHGASIGFRTLACGGFGIVLDGGGNDVTRVGEFGFGCGYFFGCGLVRDFGGNDVVEASRYGIATGAHFGLGFVIDDAGDDRWSNRSVAALAGNWDLTVSYFVDRAGDDEYDAQGLSLGCATITSVAGFFDLGGRDRYRQKGERSFGRAGHPQDADRKLASIAVFVDDGGAEDEYPAWKAEPALANGLVHVWTVQQKATQGDKAERVAGRGIFVDR